MKFTPPLTIIHGERRLPWPADLAVVPANLRLYDEVIDAEGLVLRSRSGRVDP